MKHLITLLYYYVFMSYYYIINAYNNINDIIFFCKTAAVCSTADKLINSNITHKSLLLLLLSTRSPSVIQECQPSAAWADDECSVRKGRGRCGATTVCNAPHAPRAVRTRSTGNGRIWYTVYRAILLTLSGRYPGKYSQSSDFTDVTELICNLFSIYFWNHRLII